MMKRREFITLLGSAASAWPLAARAQQPAVPVIGFLSASQREAARPMSDAFRKGLASTGFVDEHNVGIEYRFADGQYDRLPALAADLVRRQVVVITTAGSTVATIAAKAATSTIPIVFSIGADPVQMGLVATLSRPGGNVTGVSFLSTDTLTKMLEMLHVVAPNATVVAALVNPANPSSGADVSELEPAAHVLGVGLHILKASSERDIDTAFATLVEKRVGALLIEGDPSFTLRLKQLVALTVRHAIPAIYQGRRDFPDAGGLMSYGASRVDASRLAGIYAGRVLKGEKPADLPVQRSTKVELVVNLTTAKALKLDIPAKLLAIADEVIE